MLFQLDGCGHPQDGTIPSFFPGSRGYIIGLSIDVEFVSKLFWKCGETLKRVKRGANIYEGPCRTVQQLSKLHIELNKGGKRTFANFQAKTQYFGSRF